LFLHFFRKAYAILTQGSFEPRVRVLVLDDDGTSLYVLHRLLEAAGIEVIGFSEPLEAFHWLEHDLPDLMLLDIVMPGMNGYEVCQALKKAPRTRDIPLIFLTAQTESHDIVKGLEAGAVDYVTKPFESRELLPAFRHTSN
jgi:CheY-like chemotaxis protein